MSNRVKVTIHATGYPELRDKLFAELEAGGYEPFFVNDGSDPGDFCAAVSVFDPLPYVLIVNRRGNRAAAIAHQTVREAGVRNPGVLNPCQYRVLDGGRAA